MSVDAGAIVDGWHGDGARTFIVGEPSAGGRGARRHDPPGDDGRASPRRVPGRPPRRHLGGDRGRRAPGGYGIVRQFVGHGIGTEMHEEPQVPNYRTGVRGQELEPGLCLAIEPMFTLGSDDVARPAGRLDGRRPRDGTLAAHFEHTIAITDDGPEILTTVLMTDRPRLAGSVGSFDTLRVRVSVRPGRHSS